MRFHAKLTLEEKMNYDRFYKEHRKECMICGHKFSTGDCVCLGYKENNEYVVLCSKCARRWNQITINYCHKIKLCGAFAG